MPSGIFTLKQQELALGQGAWTNQPPISVNYLVVAGGGGGGAQYGGGGGAGGLLQGSIAVAAGSSLTVTVGAGGAGGTTGGTAAASGSNSVFGAISSTGGGRGGSPEIDNAAAGGSGGGGGGANPGNTTGGAGTSGQGNNGGKNSPQASAPGGGGGGAGTVGLNAGTNLAGNGGAGVASDISGIRTTYAGGGGGGTFTGGTAGAGGAGGGGNGSLAALGVSGGSNTGGGGGGGGYNFNGGAGGSGIVIISYPGTTQWFTGGTLSYANGNVIHTFYSSGTLAPTAASNYINTDYQITRSLRFNSADSAYLSRTPASASNQKTWTWSGWVKRSGLGTVQHILRTTAASPITHFRFGSDEKIRFFSNGVADLITTQVFRDVSAWGHLVVSVDTTQATSSNRIKLYWNGSQITAFDTATYPSQNADMGINAAALTGIGADPATAGEAFNGYMTEVNFIDGQALNPYSFGYFNPNTGIWSPLKFVGTYGTNGFYLNFSDNSNITSTTLGKDYSGNGNNWTPNNFSVTAGAGNDSLVDSPTAYGTDTGAGGEVRGNYCTLNPLNTVTANVTLSNGNLDYTENTLKGLSIATFGLSSGKWYWEHKIGATNYCVIGMYQSGSLTMDYLGFSGVSLAFTNGGSTVQSGVSAPTGSISSFTSSDTIGFAYNADTGTLTVYRNNVSALVYTGLTGTWFPAQGANDNASGSFNFGQRPFAYTAPSGFKALCTQNLPTPTIGATSTTQAGDYFNTVLYTGNGSTQTISGVGFQPDFVWAKDRAQAANHRLFDAVRGSSKILYSSLTIAETTSTTGLTSFDTDGFSIGSSQINDGNFNYVAWNWKANGAGSSNNAGSIQSTVSASTLSGFSIVTYTGNGSASATVGHGLGVTPSMIICKSRSATTAWYVKHTSLASNNNLLLAGTDAQYNVATGSGNGGLGNLSSSDTFGFLSGTSSADAVNLNGGTFVAYCFAAVAGYSTFGSYTGNGSSDGPFVYTGFRPAYVLIKRTDTTENWYIKDRLRPAYNVNDKVLYANQSYAEGTEMNLDMLSNGFKARGTDGGFNASGGTYVYACFAENPFKYALAR